MPLNKHGPFSFNMSPEGEKLNAAGRPAVAGDGPVDSGSEAPGPPGGGDRNDRPPVTETSTDQTTDFPWSLALEPWKDAV